MADWVENLFRDSDRRFKALPDWLKEDYFEPEDNIPDQDVNDKEVQAA